MMKIGDKVRIQPAAWGHFVKTNGRRPGEKFNPGVQAIEEVLEHEGETHYRLTYPGDHWWKAESLFEVLSVPVPESPDEAALTRAFCAVMEMWSRRSDHDLTGSVGTEGEPVEDPVVVSQDQLKLAHVELMEVIRTVNPTLYASLFAEGGVPDAPLPPDPSTVEGEMVVTDLDEVRIRMGQEFQDETIAYVEAVWGKSTYAFNAAIRDLEAMRRGHDDGTLRRPVTYHEGMHLVLHVRALANDLARNFGMAHLVRDEDDHGDPK